MLFFPNELHVLINVLSFVLSSSKTIKLKIVSFEDKEEELAKYLLTLLWLLRD